MSPAMLFVLLSLAAFRAARLIAQDAMPLFAGPRDWVVRRADRDGAGPVWDALAYLVTCMWCVGVYTSAAAVALADVWLPVPAPWLMWPAVAAAVGVLAQMLGFLDDIAEARTKGGPQVVVVPPPTARD